MRSGIGLAVKVTFLLLFISSSPAKTTETIISTGKITPYASLVETRRVALNVALKDALLKAIKLVYPYPHQITNQIYPLDFIEKYRILDEGEAEDGYYVQVEIYPDWDRLATELDRKGILCRGEGEKVLLFFKQPEDIDLKAQFLSFWNKFFLLFGLKPVYDDSLKAEDLNDYAFDHGISYIFRLAEEINTTSTVCIFQFDVSLEDTTYNQPVYQAHLEPQINSTDIEKILNFSLSQLQQIAYNVAFSFSSWLEKKKKKVISFQVVLKNIDSYKKIFDTWDKLKQIEGISDFYLREINSKQAVYIGKFRGLMPELVNQIIGLGFATIKLRDHTIEINKP
jgi:hypothetical protein